MFTIRTQFGSSTGPEASSRRGRPPSLVRAQFRQPLSRAQEPLSTLACTSTYTELERAIHLANTSAVPTDADIPSQTATGREMEEDERASSVCETAIPSS